MWEGTGVWKWDDNGANVACGLTKGTADLLGVVSHPELGGLSSDAWGLISSLVFGACATSESRKLTLESGRTNSAGTGAVNRGSSRSSSSILPSAWAALLVLLVGVCPGENRAEPCRQLEVNAQCSEAWLMTTGNTEHGTWLLTKTYDN